jgi:hypothetical protein
MHDSHQYYYKNTKIALQDGIVNVSHFQSVKSNVVELLELGTGQSYNRQKGSHQGEYIRMVPYLVLDGKDASFFHKLVCIALASQSGIHKQQNGQ